MKERRGSKITDGDKEHPHNEVKNGTKRIPEEQLSEGEDRN